MSMISLLFAVMLSSVAVDVSLSNGQRVSGDLQSLTNEGLSLVTDGKQLAISRAGLTDVTFESPKSTPSRSVYVQLTDDSIVPCDSVVLANGQLQASDGPSTWAVKDVVVRAVRWPLPGEETDEQWNEILSNAGSDDLLVIRRAASLDYLAGTVLGVTKDAIQFEYSGSTIPAPLAKAAGFILARKEKLDSAPRVRMTTHDGGLWLLRSATLEGDKLDLVSMANVKHSISLAEIARIEFPQLGAVFLSDLEASSIEFQPYFGSQLDETLAKLHAPRIDRGVDGMILRIADPNSMTGWRHFRRGLSVQSHTEMVYRLAGKYQRFRTTVGIDPAAATQADVKLTLFADDQQVYNRSISKVDPAVEVDVDVSHARRLKLVVDYGMNIHVGDQLHLGDARLIK